MTSPDPYNLEYRPSHYFGPHDLKTFYRSRIKGQIRGEMVVESIDQEEVPHEVRQPKLHEPLKEEITGIHPWMMGGEYLPDFAANEIEIARVVLQSTTMDVSSLRVKKRKNRYFYRIVDEYENTFILPQKTSTHPLKMKTVISIISECQMTFHDDGTSPSELGFVLPSISFMVSEYLPKSDILGFVSVQSAFYPNLDDYFAEMQSIWIDELFGEEYPE